jgi:uncharacterized protein (DUF427 family)
MTPAHTITTEPVGERVRVVAGGETLADSTNVVVLRETGLPDRYYFPREDVRMELLVPTTTATSCPYKGDAQYWTAQLDADQPGEIVELVDVAWSYPTPISGREDITGLVCFYNERVDEITVT